MDKLQILQDLEKRLSERGEQSRIAEALGTSRATPKRWLEGTEISPAHLKLLKLYLYGEMPFEMIRPEQDLSTKLKLSGSEWKIITILSTREGYISPQAWITAQIRGYLRNIDHTANNESSGIKNTGKTA